MSRGRDPAQPPLSPLRRVALLAVFAAAALAFWWVYQSGHQEGPVAAAGVAQLERGNGAEPDSLDPQLARMDSALTILRDAYEGLTSVAADGGVAAGVAESWEVTDGGRTYVFRLRPGAAWSNGDAVEAEDFVAAWRRLVDPATASQYAQILEPVLHARGIFSGERAPAELGVEALGPQVLKVTLEAPALQFLAILSHPATFPVHRPTLATEGARFARPGTAVTNGAFVPVEWQVGAWVRSVRNERYWDAARTRLDAVRYHHINDPPAELARFRAGELDVTYTLPPGQVARLEAANTPGLHVSPQLGVYYYGFATDKAPFAGAPALRRALSMAIDREILVRQVLGDGELAAYGWVPDGVAGYRPARYAWADWPAERRVAEARRLYAQAGYGDDKPLAIELRFNKSTLHDRLALAVSAMWKQVLGVHTTLAAEEFRVLKQSIDAREVQVFRGSWVADYNDPYTFLQLLESGFGINLPRYTSAGYDGLLADARAETDPVRRAQLLGQAEALLLEDAPLVPLFFYVSKHLVAGRVEGWYDNVMNVTYSRALSVAP